MRFAKQIGVHRLPIGPNRKVSIAKFSQNGVWSRVPTRPAKRRVSVHVLGIDPRTSIQKKLNGLFSTEGSGPMKGGLGLGSAISHEATRFNRRLGGSIWIRTSSQ